MSCPHQVGQTLSVRGDTRSMAEVVLSPLGLLVCLLAPVGQAL